MAQAKKAARVTVREGEEADADTNETATADKPRAAQANTPTALLMAMARERYTLEPLSNGKIITLEKPSALSQFRITKVVGPQSAANHTYMQMIMPFIYIVAIDDADGDGPQAVPFPSSEAEIEALIVRLDDEGVAAVAMGVMKYFNGVTQDPRAPGGMRAMTAEEMREAQRNAVKK